MNINFSLLVVLNAVVDEDLSFLYFDHGNVFSQTTLWSQMVLLVSQVALSTVANDDGCDGLDPQDALTLLQEAACRVSSTMGYVETIPD